MQPGPWGWPDPDAVWIAEHEAPCGKGHLEHGKQTFAAQLLHNQSLAACWQLQYIRLHQVTSAPAGDEWGERHVRGTAGEVQWR